MDDDDMIRALQEANRAREAESDRDRKWHALADDTLSEVELEELRGEAQRMDEGRDLFEIYRPFDAAEKEQIVAALSRGPWRSSTSAIKGRAGRNSRSPARFC